ncbi:MAG: hypothetical protein AB1427_05305 [Thermodesulfobacteriota bacterium]
MEKEAGKIYAEGLAFFGKTNRLISHELKNILAIISETMGLLDELVELSESGMELTPARLRSMSDSIVEEVERANAVIRCMNTFAHSVDEWVRDIDLGAAISLAIQLVRLDPFSKAVKIEFSENDSHVIFTSPFILENLLYHTFHYALSAADHDKLISVALLAVDDGIEIEISGIAPGGFESFPSRQVALLAKAVGAEISSDTSAGKCHIVLAKKLTGGAAEALPVNL